MQNKERVVELQMIFSRRHIGLLIGILLFMTINLIINNVSYGLEFVSCVALCVILFADVMLSYTSFFHNYGFLIGARLTEIIVCGLFISDLGGSGIGGYSDFLIIMTYGMFVIEYAYANDLSEISSIILKCLFIQIPLAIKAVLVIIFKDDSSIELINYVLIMAINYIIYLGVFSFIGSVQKYQEECLFAKDRLLDRAKDNFDKIDESQKNLVSVNEQLGIKKFELEEANRKVNTANYETKIQNELLKNISSSFDLNEILANTRRIFFQLFDLAYAGLLFKGDALRQKYNSRIDEIFNADEIREIYDFFLSDAFIETYKNINSCYIDNDISWDEFPFFERAGIRSFVVKATNPGKGYGSVYLMLSREGNAFYEKERFLENIFGQLVVASNNLYLYHEIDNMSKLDGLTGLFNRRHLNVYYEEHFINNSEDVKCVSLAMLDIDHFKKINDTYGHLSGDQAIKKVSDIINRTVGSNNGLGFRYGGEEFVVIFEDKSLEDTIAVIEDILGKIKKEPITFDNHSFYVQASAGVTSYPEITKDISRLIDRADKSMYYSKQHGRDQLTVDTGRDD